MLEFPGIEHKTLACKVGTVTTGLPVIPFNDEQEREKKAHSRKKWLSVIGEATVRGQLKLAMQSDDPKSGML